MRLDGHRGRERERERARERERERARERERERKSRERKSRERERGGGRRGVQAGGGVWGYRRPGPRAFPILIPAPQLQKPERFGGKGWSVELKVGRLKVEGAGWKVEGRWWMVDD